MQRHLRLDTWGNFIDDPDFPIVMISGGNAIESCLTEWQYQFDLILEENFTATTWFVVSPPQHNNQLS